MAQLSERSLIVILNLQRQFIEGIDRATALESLLFQQFGETEATESDLEQLQNIRQRLTEPYLRLSTLLLRVAEFQPLAPTAMLDLLDQND